MSYEMALTRISLDAYRDHLKRQEMYPSRKILHEETDVRFDIIAKQGIGDVAALRKAIGNTKKIAELSERKRYYGGVLSVKDMQVCIDYANMMRKLPQ